MVRKFWGRIFEGLGVGAGLVKGVTVGVASSLTGKGDFTTNVTANTVVSVVKLMGKFGDFGDRHNSTIKRVGATVAVGVVTGGLVDADGILPDGGSDAGAVDASGSSVDTAHVSPDGVQTASPHVNDASANVRNDGVVHFGYEGPAGQDPNISTRNGGEGVYQDTAGEYHLKSDPETSVPRSELSSSPPTAP